MQRISYLERAKRRDYQAGVNQRPLSAERDAGIVLNGDEELERGREILVGFDFDQDDGNWGINVYLAAVSEYMMATP